MILPIPIQLFHMVWRKLLAIVDRYTDPPIMRQHVNDGSYKYFAWRDKHEGDSELDEFLDPDRQFIDDDTPRESDERRDGI